MTSYKSLLFAAGCLCFTVSLNAATIMIPVLSENDGMLCDTNSDGIVDKLSGQDASKPSMEIRVGSAWNIEFRTILEFKLPKNNIKVKKAELQLCFNGKLGCFPETKGASGPEFSIYYYVAPEADGILKLSDDGCGSKLGSFQIKDQKRGPGIKVKFDVTAAVQDALEKNSKYLGLRLETDQKNKSCWRFRSSGFAKKYGKHFAPSLIIVTE